MSAARLASLLRARLGPDIGRSSDWQGSAFRVAGVVAGWYLVEDDDLGPRLWHLGYRSFADVGDAFEVERSFCPCELLWWLRGPGLRDFRQVAGFVETGVVPLAWRR